MNEKILFSVVSRLGSIVENFSRNTEKYSKSIFSGIGLSGIGIFKNKLKPSDENKNILEQISLKLDTIISKMDNDPKNLSNEFAGKFIKTIFQGTSGLMLFLIYKSLKPISNNLFLDFFKILLLIDPKTNKPLINNNSIKLISEFSA